MLVPASFGASLFLWTVPFLHGVMAIARYDGLSTTACSTEVCPNAVRVLELDAQTVEWDLAHEHHQADHIFVALRGFRT